MWGLQLYDNVSKYESRHIRLCSLMKRSLEQRKEGTENEVAKSKSMAVSDDDALPENVFREINLSRHKHFCCIWNSCTPEMKVGFFFPLWVPLVFP